MLAFNTVLCLLIAILCSLAPILLATQTGLPAVLRTGQATAGRRGSSRLFSTLIALEVGFAFLLLVGSGLMIRSLVRLQQEDHGFHPDHVLTLRVPVGTLTQPRPTGKYDTRPRQMAYYREILERVRTVAGIKAAAIVNNLPLSGINTSLDLDLRSPDGQPQTASTRTISPQYFAAMGIPLLAGRDFADSDQRGAPDVAIINEYLARRLFPNRSPLGQKLTAGSKTPGPTIVGVVKDSPQMTYELPHQGEIYIPYQQFIFATFMSTIVVRTEAQRARVRAITQKRNSLVHRVARLISCPFCASSFRGRTGSLGCGPEKTGLGSRPQPTRCDSGNDERGNCELHLASAILGLDLLSAGCAIGVADRDWSLWSRRVYIHSQGTRGRDPCGTRCYGQ